MPECGAHLMEADWLEGFGCTLPAGHPGAHRDTGGSLADNISKDEDGRDYAWVHEWFWIEPSGGSS